MVNYIQKLKGAPIEVFEEIENTSTSKIYGMKGHNSILVHVKLSATGSPEWTVKLQGAPTFDGEFVDLYDGSTALSTGTLSSDRCVMLKGVPEYIKVVATEDSGTGNCTVNIIPLTM